MSRRKRVDLQVFALATIGENVIYCKPYTSDTISQDTQNEIACIILKEYNEKKEQEANNSNIVFDESFYYINMEALDGTVYCNTKNNLTIGFLFYPSWGFKYTIIKKPLIPNISNLIHNDLESILQQQVAMMNNNKIPLYILRIQCHNTFTKRSKALQKAISKSKQKYHCRRCRLRIKYCCKNFYKWAEPAFQCIAYCLCFITCCWIPIVLYKCCTQGITCCGGSGAAYHDEREVQLSMDRSSDRDRRIKAMPKDYELTVASTIEIGTVRPIDPFSTDGQIKIVQRDIKPKKAIPHKTGEAIGTVVTTSTKPTEDRTIATMSDTLKSFGAQQWGGGGPTVIGGGAYDYSFSEEEELDMKEDAIIKDVRPKQEEQEDVDEYKMDKESISIPSVGLMGRKQPGPIEKIDIADKMKTLMSDIKSKFAAWRAARKLIDNVFTDLENLFYLLSELLYKFEFKTFGEDMKPIMVILVDFILIFVNLVIYALVMLISWVVILPSCFFLLIVRMNKVETDTVKLHERAEQLKKETKCQKFYRLCNQFGRASFMFGFLVIYPIIIMYIIIPNAGNNDSVIITCIGSYLFIIIALQVFGTYRGIRSFEERKKLKPPNEQYSPQTWKWNLGSVIAIILLFVEIFQLSIYAFHVIGEQEIENVEQDSDDGAKLSADSIGIDGKKMTKFANGVIGICYLSIDFIDEYILEYYALFSIIFVGILLLFFTVRFIYELKTYARLKWKEDNDTEAKEFYFYSFLGTIIYGHGTLKGVNKWSSKLISLLSDTLFLAICQKVVLILSCTSPMDDSKSYLRIDPDTVCWEGKHKLYATIALILLGYYIPICTMIAPIFAEDEDEAEEEVNDDEESKSNCDGGKDEEEEKESSKCKEFFSFGNTIQVVAPFMSALTVTECFMLISSEFVSRGGAYGTIVSQSICMICLMVFTLNWSFSSLGLYGLTQNEPVFPYGVSMIRALGFFCGFCGCIIEIFRYNQLIDSAVDIFLLLLIIIISSVGIFGIFWKYHSIFNEFDDDIEHNLIAIYDENEKKLAIEQQEPNEAD